MDGVCLIIDLLYVRPEEFNFLLSERDVTSGLPQSTWNCTGSVGRTTTKFRPRVNCTLYGNFR